jgi:hypothetical protein
MIDNSVLRVDQNGACVADKNHQYIGRSQKNPHRSGASKLMRKKAGDLSSAGF